MREKMGKKRRKGLISLNGMCGEEEEGESIRREGSRGRGGGGEREGAFVNGGGEAEEASWRGEGGLVL